MEDCYWKHGTTPEQRYACLDGKNHVCPRCCVECCPVESSDWFAECTLSGHPTWPSASHVVPMKLVCLESSWDNRIFHNTSVKGFFESLGPLDPSSPPGCSSICRIFKTPCALYPQTRRPVVDRSDCLGRPHFLSCLPWIPRVG